MARITDDERARRLFEIERLEQEGMSDSQIADELGLSLPVIKRSQKYLKNLKKADITPEVLAKKRSELYLEYIEIAEEAKNQFLLYKNPVECKYCEGTGHIPKIENGVEVQIDGEKIFIVCGQCKGQGNFHYPKDANRFLNTWAEIIERKAKLFGLDNIKSDNIFQFNQFNSQYVPDPMKITGNTRRQADKLVKLLKHDHEKAVMEKHEREES